ncbi:glycosyltransferase family 4 protein [Microbacterium sp. SCN 69-37]|uniref:glycosyltransferase family 4 protein n=1 Tax=Microbacterium sp. SCN 69-37 TaxID=1660115 RepID=UPI0025FB0288|nr:glycosyltransferase family 4 protein [Microbacterium sp. SCN 69-37]
MKIAIVHSYYSSSQPSGENNAVYAQAKALTDAGHSVRTIGVSTDDLSARPGYPLRAAVRVLLDRGVSPTRSLREFDPDVVHVHNTFPNIGNRWVMEWEGPLVATIHNYRSVCARGSLFREGEPCALCPTVGSASAIRHACYRGSRAATVPLAISTRSAGAHNALLKRADRLVFLSERSLATLSRVTNVELKLRAEVIPNFLAATDEPSSIELDAPWIYVGRLAEEKGILQLLEVWEPSTPLMVVGEGPVGDRARLIAARKNVHFTGNLPESQVQSHVNGSRGLVFPSLWAEPAPALAYLHALAGGRPTLTLANNAVGDHISSAASGRVFESLSSLAIAASTYESLALEGANAYRAFRNEFSPDAWVMRVETMYQRARSGYAR